MEELTSLISNIGFPIAVCIWMFVSQDKKMDQLTQAVNNNTEVIKKLAEKDDDRNG